MIKNSGSLDKVKSEIKSLAAESLKITVNLGRNRFLEFTGKLEGVYPALFTVKPFDSDFKGKTAYSYAEYMCGRVRLKKAET
ncbi:MAG: Veg family protein [Clostridia bacterium]|nr:Veg family protein [Clostridia bacterium]